MELWIKWMDAVNVLRPAFSRQRTFYWMILVLIGFTVKTDFFGVTSLARGAGLFPGYYTCMLHFFASNAVDLIKLKKYWVKFVFDNFTTAVKINGRYLLLGDGIKVGKEGRKMPGVRLLHQQSQSNSKAEYIMGHSTQVLSLVAGSLNSSFSVPLAGEIHEGYRFNCKDKRTQLDKIFELLLALNLEQPFYFVADRYYCSGRLLKQLVSSGIHIITRMKNTAVAYYPAEKSDDKKRGRRKKYGKKVKLVDLFLDDKYVKQFVEAPMPGEGAILINYLSLQLLWKPLGGLVHIVLVIHPTKGKGIFLSTDLTLDALSIIQAYGFRFKIEVMFKQACHQIGTFMYHFWLKSMAPRKRGAKEWQLHFADSEFKNKVKNKIHSYHLFMMIGFIAQGLMQYLSINHSKLVWNNFGSWLRTIRADIPPSEKVVSMAMSSSYHEFIIDGAHEANFIKFIVKRVNIRKICGLFSNDKIAA